MPKSLKQTAEPDVFDFGKAVTIVLSEVKQLNKTRNTLVDDVNYLEARKKQETDALQHLINEKTNVAKLKTELTEKIIAARSEFETNVSAKREELGLKEADVKAREDKLTVETAQLMQDVTDRQNELALRSQENKKQWDASMDALNKRETNLIAREEVVMQTKALNDQQLQDLIAQQAQLTADSGTLHNKQIELDSRETRAAENESKFEEQRLNLSKLAGDLENQASLLEGQRNRNKSDAELIRNMNKSIKDKQQELTNREIHLADREATSLTH